MAVSALFDKKLILLVGRDGNGKTSCKKSIEDVCNELGVVDFSGLGDTESDRLHDISVVWTHLRKIMENCDLIGGFKAIVFVLKYGVRFTKQEKDAVEDVKAMLGEGVFRQHGIILMSHGDFFESDHDANIGKDFMSWCREQTGDIKKLFSEVSPRVLLFNNSTDNIEIKRKQFHELRSMVISMGIPYGLSEFNAAQKLRHTPTGIMHLDNSKSTKLRHVLYTLYRPCVLISIICLIAFIALVLTKEIQL